MEIPKKYEAYMTLGLPIEFNGVDIEPVKVKDYFAFTENITPFLIDKDNSDNIELIKLTYLQMLLQIMLSDNTQESAKKILAVFTVCMGVKPNKNLYISGVDKGNILKYGDAIILKKNSDDEHYIYKFNGYDIRFESINGSVFLYICGNKFRPQEFDELRLIILFQNLYNFDDALLARSYREVIEKYNNIVNKGKEKICLEDKIVAVMSKTSQTLEQLCNMPYRIFEKLFSTIVYSVDYTIYKMAEANGAEFKKPIKHWVNKDSGDKYEGVLKDNNNLVEKTIR